LGAGEAELGYWTAAPARGRAVATRAGRAVSQWATDVLGIQRLVWRAAVGNHAARLVGVGDGFTVGGGGRCGLRSRDGRRIAGWHGSLLPGEVLSATPEKYASGSVAARRAAAFGQAQPTLDTGRGALRPHIAEDLPPLIEAYRDPET